LLGIEISETLEDLLDKIVLDFGSWILEIVCEPIDFLSPIAIVGAGTTSKDFFRSIKNLDVDVRFVVDSNPDLIGLNFDETDLSISPLQSLKFFNGDVLVLCAGNFQLVQSLQALGIRKVNYFYNYSVNKHFYANWRNQFPNLSSLMADLKDSVSVSSLEAIVEAADDGNFLKAFHISDPKPYFSQETITIHQGDVVLDLGTYRGAHLRSLTIQDLIYAEKFICLEPNLANNPYILSLFDDDPVKMDVWRRKLDILNVAIKDKPGTGYSADLSMANKVVGDSFNFNSTLKKPSIQLVTLDELRHLSPTIVTCDIEGDELNLINGGHAFFSQLEPRVAISTYHHVGHLSEIYEYFKKLHPSSFQFRLHDYGFMDQVLYVHFA